MRETWRKSAPSRMRLPVRVSAHEKASQMMAASGTKIGCNCLAADDMCLNTYMHMHMYMYMYMYK